MKFISSPLAGAWIIEIEPNVDKRGFFSRTFCMNEYSIHDLETKIFQQSISWNPLKGTLRGLHYQIPPFEEVKVVRVTQGAVYDVIVDIRKDSETCGQWFGVELSAVNRRQLYIPAGFAHGFQTLVNDTEVFYQMNGSYNPKAGRGFRFDDPVFNITWPLEVDVEEETMISLADKNLPFWSVK